MENQTMEQENAEQLLERHPIENTPFQAVRYEDEWYLLMGKYRLTEGLETLEDVISEAGNTSWNRLLAIMHIMIKEYNNKEEKE